MTVAHFCTDDQVREDQRDERPKRKAAARDWAVGALDLLILEAWWGVGLEPLRNLATLLAYEEWRISEMRGRQRRKVAVDVEALVGRWAEVLVALSVAHDPEERTRADEQTDELLSPLLTAPLAQLREFALLLGARLEADPRVPFLVWSGFRRVVEPLILKGPDGAAIELKTTLAREIAELVEKDLDRAELIAAIAGALQWRAPEALEKVKAGLEGGAKPRVRGRESCLFLEVGDVMVVL